MKEKIYIQYDSTQNSYSQLFFVSDFSTLWANNLKSYFSVLTDDGEYLKSVLYCFHKFPVIKLNVFTIVRTVYIPVLYVNKICNINKYKKAVFF